MEREKVGIEVGVRDGRFRLPDERKPEPVGDTLEKVLQMPSSSRSGVRLMMNASNLPGEAPGAPGPRPAPADTRVSPTLRLIAGLVGALLVLIILSHVRLAMLGIAGAGIGWQVQRYRRRPYTRTSGWFGAVVSTAVAFLVVVAALAAYAPAGMLDKIQQNAIQDQAHRPRPQPPAFLRQLTPGVQSSAAGDSLARQMLRSRPTMIAVLVVSGVMGVAIGSVVFGTLGWATVTALLFAAFGQWTFETRGSMLMPN